VVEVVELAGGGDTTGGVDATGGDGGVGLEATARRGGVGEAALDGGATAEGARWVAAAVPELRVTTP
jgi:hypothetical protein